MTKFTALAAAVVLVVVDQLIKLCALATLAPTGESITVIPGLFLLTYVENYGAAFGILHGKTGFLSVVVSLVLIIAITAILTGKVKNKFLIWSGALVVAGGAGNLVDRITRGFVVDYLDFSALFGFPVFNFADCCVVVGTAMILIHILFSDNPGEDAPASVRDDPKKET